MGSVALEPGSGKSNPGRCGGVVSWFQPPGGGAGTGRLGRDRSPAQGGPRGGGRGGPLLSAPPVARGGSAGQAAGSGCQAGAGQLPGSGLEGKDGCPGPSWNVCCGQSVAGGAGCGPE